MHIHIYIYMYVATLQRSLGYGIVIADAMVLDRCIKWDIYIYIEEPQSSWFMGTIHG